MEKYLLLAVLFVAIIAVVAWIFPGIRGSVSTNRLAKNFGQNLKIFLAFASLSVLALVGLALHTAWLLAGMLGIIFFLLVAYYLAREYHVPWTFVPEGHLVVILQSKVVWRMIANVQDYFVHPKSGDVYCIKKDNSGNIATYSNGNMIGLLRNEYDQLVVEKDTGYKPATLKKRGLEHIGLYWVGIPPFREVYKYQHRWNKVRKGDTEKGENPKEYVFEPRDEQVSSTIFRYPYGMEIHGARTKGNAEIIMDLVATVEVVNLYKMHFMTHDFLVNTEAAITTIITDYSGQREIEGITQEVHSDADSLLQKLKRVLNTIEENDRYVSLAGAFGVRIAELNYKGFRFTGTQKVKMDEAAVAETVAERERRATVKEADGEAYAIREKGKATAEAQDAFFAARAAHDPNGVLSLPLAIEKTNISTFVWDGSKGSGTSLLISSSSKAPTTDNPIADEPKGKTGQRRTGGTPTSSSQENQEEEEQT